jgi:prolyl 4-hydroxylase
MLTHRRESSSVVRRRRRAATPTRACLVACVALACVFAWVASSSRASRASSRRRRLQDSPRDIATDVDADDATVPARRHRTTASSATVEPLSWTPRAFALRNILTPEECDAILGRARAAVRRSTVIDSVTGESKIDPIRTSKQTFLARESDVVMALYEKLSAVTLLPWMHNEDLQVLRYDVGEKYDAHEDVGDEGSVSGKELSREGGQRVATVLLYLEEPEEGGETAFPDSEWIDGWRRDAESWSPCAAGRVAMKPKRGDGLMFWSVQPNGNIDHRAIHTGCPVLRGTKWTATVWVHATPYRWTPPPEPERPPGCADDDDRCRGWANTGECEKNPGFMLTKCPWSCRIAGCEH